MPHHPDDVSSDSGDGNVTAAALAATARIVATLERLDADLDDKQTYLLGLALTDAFVAGARTAWGEAHAQLIELIEAAPPDTLVREFRFVTEGVATETALEGMLGEEERRQNGDGDA